MDLGVKDKVALITGGGEGIGKEAAFMLAREGAHVALGDVDEAKVLATTDELKGQGFLALGMKVDVTHFEELKGLAQAAIKEFGRIDILLHTPGRGERKPFTATERSDWDFVIQLNLYGVLNAVKAIVDTMIAQKSGSMAFVVSDAGRVGETFNTVYSAAKAGVIAFSKAIAKELGRHNIRVNCVALSAMNTPGGLRFREQIAQAMGNESLKDLEKKILSNYVLRRFGEVEDAAGALCFLASDRASWITGQTLSVNGGYCMI